MRMFMSVLVVLFFMAVALVHAEDRGWHTIYDNEWNAQGYIKQGSFAEDRYYIYDKDWNRKGCIKWNDFSERYEIYDKNWDKKGCVDRFPGSEVRKENSK